MTRSPPNSNQRLSSIHQTGLHFGDSHLPAGPDINPKAEPLYKTITLRDTAPNSGQRSGSLSEATLSPATLSAPTSPRILSMDRHNRMTPASTPGTSDTPSLKRAATASLAKGDKRQRGASVAMASNVSGESFPAFDGGNVIIIIKLGEAFQQYQLHRIVLERSSTWFRDVFAAADSIDPKPSQYYFTLGETSTLPILIQRTREEMGSDIDVPADTPETTSTGQIQVKAEQIDEGASETAMQVKIEDSTAARNRGPSQADIVSAYKSLFRTFYNFAPQISPTNVKCALSQCEILVKLAQEYGALSLIRPHLGNLLSQFRQTLFVSIKTDPPRWLRLAIDLESPMIYTEALIHLIGCHPAWPWATPKPSIPPTTIKLIKAKAQELKKLCAGVERDLFMNDIQDSAGAFVSLAGDFETWLAAQLFRDWFCRELRGAHYRNSEVVNPLKIGLLYRRIRKGGEAYLPYDQVLKTLSERVRDKTNSWEDLADDLKLLKEYASKTVEEVTRNRLMLEVEGNGIGYLTCVDVGPADYQWAVGVEE